MLTEADQRRDELESILASAIFRKAPNQSRLLRYLCEKGIDGGTEQLKEHQIAIEALGRKDNFDERENSIVRVEISRLRKRLRQYYETEGRGHPVRIAIDPGRYVARFVPAEADTLAAEADAVAPREDADGDAYQAEDTATPTRPGWRAPWWVAVLAAAVLLAVGVAAWRVWRASFPLATAQQAQLEQSPAAAEPGPSAISDGTVRILAGYDRPVHIDRLGRTWRGDIYYSGGESAAAPRQFLARTSDPIMFRHYRFGNFSYNVPLKRGVYEMRLYFGPGVRPWTFADRPEGYAIVLFINGRDLMFFLNFGADAINGPTPDVRVFKDISPAADGYLHLQFKSANQYDYVNAIEITPSARGRMMPVRFTSRDYSYTDVSGKIWEPDHYARGGTLVERRDPVKGTPDPDLFSGERFGNFDYLVPVATPGTYSVELGLAETWFGPTMPGGGGAGSRSFTVSCNGTQLLKDIDVYREAGGSNRALVKTFHGLHPDTDGKLRLSFIGAPDKAMVNFVEIRDESK